MKTREFIEVRIYPSHCCNNATNFNHAQGNEHEKNQRNKYNREFHNAQG